MKRKSHRLIPKGSSEREILPISIFSQLGEVLQLEDMWYQTTCGLFCPWSQNDLDLGIGITVICIIPTGSMYGTCTYTYHKNQPNVGKHTIYGSLWDRLQGWHVCLKIRHFRQIWPSKWGVRSFHRHINPSLVLLMEELLHQLIW